MHALIGYGGRGTVVGRCRRSGGVSAVWRVSKMDKDSDVTAHEAPGGRCEAHNTLASPARPAAAGCAGCARGRPPPRAALCNAACRRSRPAGRRVRDNGVKLQRAQPPGCAHRVPPCPPSKSRLLRPTPAVAWQRHQLEPKTCVTESHSPPIASKEACGMGVGICSRLKRIGTLHARKRSGQGA